MFLYPRTVFFTIYTFFDTGFPTTVFIFNTFINTICIIISWRFIITLIFQPFAFAFIITIITYFSTLIFLTSFKKLTILNTFLFCDLGPLHLFAFSFSTNKTSDFLVPLLNLYQLFLLQKITWVKSLPKPLVLDHHLNRLISWILSKLINPLFFYNLTLKYSLSIPFVFNEISLSRWTWLSSVIFTLNFLWSLKIIFLLDLNLKVKTKLFEFPEFLNTYFLKKIFIVIWHFKFLILIILGLFR